MANYPSSLVFASMLQYAPRGQSATSVLSREVTYKIKQDGYTSRQRIIDYAIHRLAQELPAYPFLAGYFHNSATVVPVPRSSPLVNPQALWVPRRICQSLMAQGLAANVMPCLERKYAVQKSSTAAAGQRPRPDQHYDSVEVSHQGLLSPRTITLIDDVVTRGSSFVGIVPRLREAFPGIEIRCFALVRTVSGREVDRILDPVEGSITYNGTDLHRHP